MLNFPKKKYKIIGKAQAGFYIDFFFKKIIEVFIRNFFIYTALFFGEKYMIEQLTKKTLDNLVFNSNKFIGWTILCGRWFFFMNISIVLYTIFFVNLCLFFS